MIATLVIGLREGLEATLIVGIIAAFLRRNRVPLWPMWIGVGASVALSIAVGVGLQVVAQALPQQQQEGMEAVIGVVAIAFVTAMVVWMRKHSRNLRDDIETVARRALGRGTAWGLAGMAFLAILKEGFETSVFLLAAFQASSNAALAAAGAVVGIAVAVAIGFGIYTGGVRLDLGRFFVGTGVFLVFVAAGLVVTVLRRAHEAGWLTLGQQTTVDLSWLVPPGSVRFAVLNGLLGVLPDPRVIEALGWALYLVPVLALTLWPRRLRPRPSTVPRIRLAVAAGLAVAAVALVVAVPSAPTALDGTLAVRSTTGIGRLTLVSADDHGLSATLTGGAGAAETLRLPSSARTADSHRGVAADRWRSVSHSAGEGLPATLTVDDLVSRFGRVPVGISPTQEPGPFTAAWSVTTARTVWTVGGGLLDASRSDRVVVTLSGGGLTSSRTYSLPGTSWSATGVDHRAAAALSADSARSELALWRVWLPLALGIAAATQLALAALTLFRPSSPRTSRSLDRATA
ncbi:iron uptake transporter permease EfeU [Frondihabitans australicus]|uniref:High-affinity iron transporter n=1 Tax=Frondihabitans australicus TaxID=386892 RepID=A0A495ID03_9MICO|nr:iron uptake transporter permease EfeU [Frondihabitans australicus]RKR73338.1 high-affinity iron transporter [Frondihabitans australicus]